MPGFGGVFVKQSVKYLLCRNIWGLVENSYLLVSSENSRGKKSGCFLPQTVQTHEII